MAFAEEQIDIPTNEIAIAEKWFIELTTSHRYKQLETLLSPDFIFINDQGRVLERNSFLEILNAAKIDSDIATLQLNNIRILSPTSALAVGTIQTNIQRPGASRTVLSVYSRVWVKHADKWFAASLHVSDAQLIHSWEKMLKTNRDSKLPS